MSSDTPQDWVTVAQIVAPHGVKGTFLISSLSDNPRRFNRGQSLYLDGVPHKIRRSVKLGPRTWILRLEGVTTREQAEDLKDKLLAIPPEEALVLPESTYYHHQLIGLKVYTLEGEFLGAVAEILETGSNDVYVVKSPSEEVLIPALKSVIISINLEEGVMVADLPEGLR